MKAILAIALAFLFAAPAKAQYRDGRPVSGEEVYRKICAYCHDDGTVGAPLLGDKKAWAPRLAKEREALYAGPMKGREHMPKRLGRQGFDEGDVRRAVDYILSKVEN